MNLASLSLWPSDEKDILDFYDCPLVFFERDDTGQLWFLWMIAKDTFLCYPVNAKEDFNHLFEKKEPIQKALQRLPCHIGKWSSEGDLVSEDKLASFSADFISKYLPEEDVYY